MTPPHRLLRLPLLLALVATLAGCAGRGASVDSGFDPDSIADAYPVASAALTSPATTRSFHVRADGDLENGVWQVALRPEADGREAGPPRRIAAERRWLPVLRWTRSSGAVRWEFEAVALPAPAPLDSVLMVSLRVRATNRGATPSHVRFATGFAAPDSAHAFFASDVRADGAPPAWAIGGEREHIAGAVTWPRGATVTGGAADPSATWTLAPGGSLEVRVVLASEPIERRPFDRWASLSHERRVDETRRRWTGEVDRGTRFALGDAEVEDAIRAARVVLLSARDHRGGRWLPTGGPFQYHDVWLRDGARSIAALAVSGYSREARQLADGFTAYQWPQGAFTSQRGQPDGTGEALWAFAQATLRPAPDSSAERFAVLAVGATHWMEQQREFGRQAHWPFSRMLPFADPHDGELVRAQLTGTDAWALAGHEAAARLLRAAGHDADAVRVDSLRRAYAADFRDALARSRSADIPPSWQGPGRDWGNLAVGWPCRALAADDPRLAALATRVWNRSSAPSLVGYGADDARHVYLGADLGTWALLAGRPADANRVLDALLRWRDATGAAGELISSAGAFGMNLPPHPTSAAALVALTRNMLVYDDGDTLQLTLGGREAWWRDGQVRGAPTRWGTIDLAFRRQGARAQWKWTPVAAWTALTLPPGTRLAAPPPAPLVGAEGGRVVLAPPHTAQATATIAASTEGPR